MKRFLAGLATRLARPISAIVGRLRGTTDVRPLSTPFYALTVPALDGTPLNLSRFSGQVTLVVNVASECGFTPQYAGLQRLHERLAGRGLVVLGFPCNQFRQQEPGSNAAIASFCEGRYGVSFPMHAKIDVNGPRAHPLFAKLKRDAKGVLGTEAVKWNFTKFLVDRDGRVIKRYAPATKPDAIEQDIEALL